MNTDDLRAVGISSAEAARNAAAALARMREALLDGPDVADLEALDAANHARDLRDEHDDLSWRDRD